jgi:4-amino-4-deoxy-L-arabinose transferase-like glycosyltransferase
MNKGSNLYHNIISKRLNLIYLALILIGAFIVRIIPSRHLTFAGNDAYLHHDIVLRLSEQGLGMISADPASLMGLKDYAYPPLYHIIGTLLYNATHSELIFFIIPPILGVATIFVFYKIAQELFENGKTVILSTLLFAFVPAFVTRTSVFIPESLGLLLFTSIIY